MKRFIFSALFFVALLSIWHLLVLAKVWSVVAEYSEPSSSRLLNSSAPNAETDRQLGIFRNSEYRVSIPLTEYLHVSAQYPEFLRGLIVKHAGLLSRALEPLKRMKIGDRVYLITDQLQTGAGIPGMICALQDDSAVEVAVDFTHGTKILKVRNWDILPSNLYTHSILNVVYQTHEKIEHKYGSILNFTIEEIVAQLIQQGLAPQTASLLRRSL